MKNKKDILEINEIDLTNLDELKLPNNQVFIY